MGPEAARGTLVSELEILEIEITDPELAPAVAARLSRMLRLPCRLAGPPPGLGVPMLPGRSQGDADRLLALVEALPPRQGRIRVALTGQDVGHPVFTHFFGRARHGGSAVLVSAARLDPRFYGLPADHVATARRCAIEVIHELGHVAGLGHCARWNCVMHFAATVDAVDNRGGRYCGACADALPAGLAAAGR